MATRGYVLTDTNSYQLGIKIPKGEFYIYAGTSTIGIAAVNVYHAVHDSSVAGTLEGFTFSSGGLIDGNIASEADASGQLQITTSIAHGLTTGDVVVLTNMNNAAHNAPTIVTVIDTTNFTCDNIAYVAGAGASAGIVDEPAYLQAGTDTAGTYLLFYSLTGLPSLATKTYRIKAYIGATAQNNTTTDATPGSATPDTQSGGGYIQLSSGDKVWLGIANLTDATDLTLRHCSLRVVKE